MVDTLLIDQEKVVLRKNYISTESAIISGMLTNSGGIGPSILVVQTAENRRRNDPPSLGYCFDLAIRWQFLLNLIGNTWP